MHEIGNVFAVVECSDVAVSGKLSDLFFGEVTVAVFKYDHVLRKTAKLRSGFLLFGRFAEYDHGDRNDSFRQI